MKKARFMAWVWCDCNMPECKFYQGKYAGLNLGEIPNQPGHFAILDPQTGKVSVAHGVIEVPKGET